MMKYGLALSGAAVVATVALTGNNKEDARKLVEVTPYGLKMIQANELELGPSPPLICIVDSGIDLDHPEFDASMIDGMDNDNRFWMDPIKWNNDVTGHGTTIAGTIAAIAGNDIGIAGAANFPLYITRGLDDEGQAYASDIKKAVQQCVDADSKIILLGLGGKYDPRHQAFYDEIVNDKGIMVIAAAGNDAEESPAYPARYESVIAVGGVGETGAPWGMSAQDVEFVGPAVDVPVISAIGHQAEVFPGFEDEELTVHAFDGTGSASAYVAAAAGLLWSHFDQCTNEQIRIALAKTAYNWNDMSGQVGEATERTASNPEDEQIGHGVPQVFDAFFALQKWGCDLSNVEDITEVGPDDFTPLDKQEQPPMDVEGNPDMLTMESEGNVELSGGAVGSIVAFVVVVFLIGGFVAWTCVRDPVQAPAAVDPVKDDDETVDFENVDYEA